MKKTILLAGFSIATVAFVVAVNINAWSARPNVQESLLDENIEALSNGEAEQARWTCYNTITAMDGHQVRYCPECKYISGIANTGAIPSSCLASE